MLSRNQTAGSQPSEAPVTSLHDVPLDSLMFVRVQGGLQGCEGNENGDLVLSRKGSGRDDSINTFHIADNATSAIGWRLPHAESFIRYPSPSHVKCAVG